MSWKRAFGAQFRGKDKDYFRYDEQKRKKKVEKSFVDWEEVCTFAHRKSVCVGQEPRLDRQATC